MARGLIKGKKAKEYEKRILSMPRTTVHNKLILQNISFSSTTKICDLGCGSGNTIELLKKKTKEITGIDGSKDMINICKERFFKNPNVKIKLASCDKTGLKADYFNYIIIKNVLHHVKDKKSLLKEARRILKPKGKIILIDRYYKNIFSYYFREILELIFKFNTRLLGHFILSKEANSALLKNFKILKEKYFPEPKGKITQSFMFILEK